MCEQVDGQASDVRVVVTDSPSPMEAEIVSLWAVVNDLREELRELREGQREELTELRMGQRKAVLEELAAFERPLVEQGVLAQRTRPPRHGGESTR